MLVVMCFSSAFLRNCCYYILLFSLCNCESVFVWMSSQCCCLSCCSVAHFMLSSRALVLFYGWTTYIGNWLPFNTHRHAHTSSLGAISKCFVTFRRLYTDQPTDRPVKSHKKISHNTANHIKWIEPHLNTARSPLEIDVVFVFSHFKENRNITLTRENTNYSVFWLFLFSQEKRKKASKHHRPSTSVNNGLLKPMVIILLLLFFMLSAVRFLRHVTQEKWPTVKHKQW